MSESTSYKYIEKIKILLNVSEQDELLLEIVSIVKEKILSYLNLEEMPKQLDWIVIELSVSRFNRIGSEGMSSESVDGVSNTYITDELIQYKPYLDDYLKANTQNKGYKLF